MCVEQKDKAVLLSLGTGQHNFQKRTKEEDSCKKKNHCAGITFRTLTKIIFDGLKTWDGGKNLEITEWTTLLPTPLAFLQNGMWTVFAESYDKQYALI